MKIMILTNNSGGLFGFRSELLVELVKTNYVVVATPFDDKIPELRAIGVKLINTAFNRHGTNPLNELKLMSCYHRLLKQEKPDIVLTYTIKPTVYGGISCCLLHTAYMSNITGLGVSIENGGLMAKFCLLLYKVALRKAKCVFFQNQSNKSLFENRNIAKGQTRLIPGSGVNTDDHAFKEYPSTDDGIRFLFIGRIMRDKGINELLEAIRIVHEQYPQVSLDIVGGFDEDYSTVIEEAQKTGYIRYHGRQPHVHEFIENAHCTVLPSYHEGTANVLLESASTGRPVISCMIPGCQETFDDGVTGLGCEVKNVQSLVEAMEKFIELPFEKKAEMGHLGREKMIREYDRSIVINAYLEEISNAIKETK